MKTLTDESYVRKLNLLFLSLILCGQALAIDPPPAITTTSSLSAQGEISTIPAGSNIRLVNHNKNYSSWFHEVRLVNEDNKPLSGGTLKVSQSYLASQMATTIDKNLQFIDEQTGDTVTGYPGQKYIVVASNNKGWKTYKVQFVDEEGAGVDHKGIPTNYPHYYKIDQRIADADRLRKPLATFGNVVTATEQAGAAPNEPCEGSSTAVSTSLRPEQRPENLTVGTIPPTNPGVSSYTFLKNNRAKLREGGIRSCMNKKAKIEKEYLAKHDYGKLNISQRANRIHSDAKSVLRTMKQASGSKNNKSSSRYKSYVDGHYIDSVVTPEVAACLSYQETKGTLNPYAVNYTLCNSKMTSTAHGLGQMTKRTMTGLRNLEGGKSFPMNTKYSSKYKGMSSADMHAKMSGDVGMQFEVLYRLLSSNAKFIRWKNRGLSDAEVLRRAVIMYDRDAQSKYIRNVITNCVPCMRQGKSGAECYKKVK